jgi:integrase
VRGALWSEIDVAGRVWTIPPERMKASKEHRVPLSDEALRLLEALPRFAGNDLVFPSPRGLVMSDMTLDRRHAPHEARRGPARLPLNIPGLGSRAHQLPARGGRNGLAHAIGNAVEAAYRRGDLFEKRARMMQEWAKFCDTITPAGEVVPIRGRPAA